MTPAEKIDLIVKELEGGNQAAFAKKVGLAESTVSRVKSGNMRLTEKVIMKVISTYPLVSADWLRGKSDYPGDISTQVVREKLMAVIADKDVTIARLAAEIERQGRIIDTMIDKKSDS